MKTVNILAVQNGVGISRDVAIIKDILVKAGYEVDTNHIFRYEPGEKKYDIAIHLERFHPKTFTGAKNNVLIPNQEWFEPGWLPVLHGFDVIFTKTHFATKVFQDLGAKTEYISFTSEDRYMPDLEKCDYHYLHIVGKSIQKQTDIVVQTWEKNPGFPPLTVIHDPKFYKPRTNARNITYIYDRLPEPLLKAYQNVCAVHVCPSETEGFGHYIMEGMSCKSIVITTNAPPMTELVEAGMGHYVEPVSTEPMRLSIKFKISTDTLERAVVEAITLPESVRREIGEKARAKFLANDAFFRNRLLEAVAATIN